MRRKVREHRDYILVREAISDLFKELRKHGFVARMCFTCCGSCGSYEGREIAVKQSKNKLVFYHRQNDESFKYDGKVYLHYLDINEQSHDEDCKRIGQEIVEIIGLNHPNIEAVWDGDPDKCIIVQRKGRYAEENTNI